MKKNDKRIMELRETIAERRSEIAKVKPFKPKTNCSLVMLDGVRYNLHAIDEQTAKFALIHMNSMHASERNIFEKYGIDLKADMGGYSLQDWIDDLLSRLENIQARTKKIELDALEAKLTALLSDDKQTELAIDELEALLE